MTQEELKRASYIDSTVLEAKAGQSRIIDLCEEAKEYQFASVCINPCYVSLAHKLLKDTGVKVCTVIGFPLGATSSASKAYEAKVAVQEGAQEVDMVVNVGAIKDKNEEYSYKDIKAVVDSAKGENNKTLVKVIIETCYLTDEEKVWICKIAQKAGADFVKTSTGFGTGGANAHDVALMRETVGPLMGVKASGGVRSREDFDTMIKAGASRIGTSHGKELI